MGENQLTRGLLIPQEESKTYNRPTSSPPSAELRPKPRGSHHWGNRFEGCHQAEEQLVAFGPLMTSRPLPSTWTPTSRINRIKATTSVLPQQLGSGSIMQRSHLPGFFNQTDIPTPRAGHAWVHSMVALWGFMSWLKDSTKRLKRHFEDVSGNLYDGGFLMTSGRPCREQRRWTR